MCARARSSSAVVFGRVDTKVSRSRDAIACSRSRSMSPLAVMPEASHGARRGGRRTVSAGQGPVRPSRYGGGRHFPQEVPMDSLPLVLVALVVGAAVGLAARSWRSRITAPAVIDARLEAQASELRRLADAASVRDLSGDQLRPD